MANRDYTQTFNKRTETTERHTHMKCVTRECKIKAKTKDRKNYLNRLFIESKWITNYYLQLHKDNKTPWSKIPTKDDAVIVKYPLGWETRSLYAISSSMKQALRDRLKANEKSMLTNIANGNIAHGELHYINDLNSIPLANGCRENEKMQSFRIMDDHKHIQIQGDNKRTWRIYGGEQIPKNAEIANGKIIKRNDNFYIQITYYIDWTDEERTRIDHMPHSLDHLDGIGLDFGIETNITTSDCDKLNWYFEETPRLKAAQRANEAYRKWHQKAYGWADNSKRQLKIIARENDILRRRKQDAINKLIHSLRKAGFVAVQEEQIKRWHADERYSDVVQHSILGGIMRRLLEQPTTLSISKWSRTTGVCPDCGHVLKEKLDTSVREWVCPECGARHDRDVAASRVILMLAAVQETYPSRPVAVSCEVFCGLLRLLGLDVPAECASPIGEELPIPDRLRAAVVTEH